MSPKSRHKELRNFQDQCGSGVHGESDPDWMNEQCFISSLQLEQLVLLSEKQISFFSDFSNFVNICSRASRPLKS